MSEGVSTAYLMKLIDRMATQPIHEIMREDERARGYLPIIPGERPWLSADDWPEHVVISTNGHVVRIIAIVAREPGRGAFRRLVAAIQVAGMTPHVVAPTREMQATLRRWGWAEKRSGFGFEAEDWFEPLDPPTSED